MKTKKELKQALINIAAEEREIDALTCPSEQKAAEHRRGQIITERNLLNWILEDNEPEKLKIKTIISGQILIGNEPTTIKLKTTVDVRDDDTIDTIRNGVINGISRDLSSAFNLMKMGVNEQEGRH